MEREDWVRLGFPFSRELKEKRNSRRRARVLGRPERDTERSWKVEQERENRFEEDESGWGRQSPRRESITYSIFYERDVDGFVEKKWEGSRARKMKLNYFFF